MSSDKKLFLTLIIIFLVRLGNFIPIPYINYDLVKKVDSNLWINYLFDSSLGFFNLGISSYINSSLIIQFLTPIIPYLEKLQQEEGEIGREKILKYTKLLSFFLAIVQGTRLIITLRPYIFEWNNFIAFKLILFLVTGSIICIWFSELISEKGFGNGTSILICLNLFERLPIATKDIFYNFTDSNSLIPNLSIFLIIFPLIIGVILFFQSTLKEIDIISSKQFTSKFLSEEMYTLPFRLNQSGVMALVFTSTSIYLIGNFISQINTFNTLIKDINPTVLNILYNLLSSGFIIFFNYYYSTIFVDSKKLSDELRKMSATIPKIQPGKPTAKYLKKVLNRVYLLGGINLAVIVFFSDVVSFYSQNVSLRTIGISSLFILVGSLIESIYKYEEIKNSPELESTYFKRKQN
jgi:preprotein translocase subunit SecY